MATNIVFFGLNCYRAHPETGFIPNYEVSELWLHYQRLVLLFGVRN